MLPNLIFGSLLIVLALGMFALHYWTHRSAERTGLSERELNFARGQYRGRLQVCTLLAVIGAAIIGGIFMRDSLWSAGYWICVLILVCGVGVLAVADLMRSRAHLLTLRDEQAVEHAALKAELAKFLPAQHADPHVNGVEREL